MESAISSWTANVPFFCLTLTLVFKVKLLEFYYFCGYLTNGVRWSKHYCCHQIGSHEFIFDWRHCEFFTSSPWPTFSRSRVLKCEYLESYGALIFQKWWELLQKCVTWLLEKLIFAIEWHHCECCTPWPRPSFSRSNISLLCICYTKCADSGCFRQICLDSHSLRRGVALVKRCYAIDKAFQAFTDLLQKLFIEMVFLDFCT